jgi:hypothetical protein
VVLASPLLQVLKMKKLRPYIPDFNLAFEHFCIHTGGSGVITEIQKQLRLHPDTVRPSQEALYRYGNTSSASIWCATEARCRLLVVWRLRLRVQGSARGLPPISRRMEGFSPPPSFESLGADGC